MRFSIFLALLACVGSIGAQPEPGCFPVIKEGKWGYINARGEMVIAPRFFSAQSFSHGLAAVREKGTYGYIDARGKMVIEPRFDMAYAFENGFARVYLDGKPYIIDEKGKIVFEHPYTGIAPFTRAGYAVVETSTKKKGIINRQGKLVIDTLYGSIGGFTNGIATVYSVPGIVKIDSSDEEGDEIVKAGIIDTLGRWIVKYDTYRSITSFTEGVAKVEKYNGETGFIDMKGNYLFSIPKKKWHLDYPSEIFSNGVTIINIYTVDPDEVKVWSSDKRYDYMGAIDREGHILFSDKDWEEATPFSHNRAFVKADKKWYLIDKKGAKVVLTAFEKIVYDEYDNRGDLFEDGIAFVKTAEGWCAIDTNGNCKAGPLKFGEFERYIRRSGSVLIINEDISVESDKYDYKYGFWDAKRNVLVSPRFHYIDESGFTDELIYVVDDEKMGYVDYTGAYVWKEKESRKGEEVLNIDYMNRGYYYASSPYKAELAGYGGHGGSDNKPKKIPESTPVASGRLQLVIDTTGVVPWGEDYKGYKMFVINAAKDTTYFDAQDSRLYLKLQALDKKGEWKDIEYIPNSWCGNSYHTLYLAPEEFWEFTMPLYEGEIKTKIRAELKYRKSLSEKGNEIIYSNVINASVNPGQFWNRRAYYARGIMDPYNE